MSQDCMNVLSLLSLQHELLQQVHCESVIRDFAPAKARRVKLRCDTGHIIACFSQTLQFYCNVRLLS